MKKLILIITLIVTVNVTATEYDSFCSGWNDGYKQGWCYQDQFCLGPLVPLCPLPRLGEDNYSGGYNRGFIQGMNDRSRTKYY